MEHDHAALHGGKGSKCDKNKGIMTYADQKNLNNPWSTCNKNDVQKHYNAILNFKMPWCLEAVSTNFCSTSVTGTTTTKATTKATTTKGTTKGTTSKGTTSAPATTTEGGGSGEGGPDDYDNYGL